MSWLAVLFAFQAGIIPNGNWAMYEVNQPLPQLYYTEFEAEATIYDHFFVHGLIRTTIFKQEEGHTFNPISDEYEFGAGVRLGLFTFGYRHLCTHPVFPYGYRHIAGETIYEGAYDEFYGRIEIEL